MTAKKDPNAVALGRKGGKARAASLSSAERSAQARQAAKERLNVLTPTQRSDIARKAAKARWSKRKKQ